MVVESHNLDHIGSYHQRTLQASRSIRYLGKLRTLSGDGCEKIQKKIQKELDGIRTAFDGSNRLSYFYKKKERSVEDSAKPCLKCQYCSSIEHSGLQKGEM